MDNNVIESAANKIDKQKKRSKLIKMLKEVPEATTPEKSKRSFWKNLFKFKTKQADHSEAQAHRLNTIYEESQSADEKNTEMELEQIKNTLRDIANNSNPSVLITGLIAHNIDVPKDDLLHDDLAGYLTDDSSEQDEDEVEEEEKKIAHLNNSLESEAENAVTFTEPEANKPVIKEEGKKISEEKLNVKDAYSFEYSEKSGNSSEEVADDKPDKVKFDEKVEAKDVDNNIVLTPLNETESKTLELQNELLKALNANETTEEKLADDLKNSNLKANSSSEQKEDLQDIFPTTDEAARRGLEDSRCNGTSENWLHCEEDLNNSTPSSFHKLEATESSEICEEYVIWSKKLNDFSDIAPKAAIPTLNNKNEIKIEEPRFENNFTMISGNKVNYSIAFDPLFNDFAAKQLEETNKKYVDDKQKVIRKRKMMSLLHDKQIFKDYMKEIEENDIQNNKKDYKYDDAQLYSSLTKDSQNNTKDLCKLFFKLPQNKLNTNDSSSNNSEKSTTEETLAILERTKNKLANFLQKDAVLEPKIQSLYPNNYLEKFNFKNRVPIENVSNNNSFGQTDISTIHSNLSAVSHEKIHTSEALLFQVHSLSNKMINPENSLEKIQANQKMQILIDELMLNINELQETCMQVGTSISSHSSDPLVSFTPIGDSEAIVSPIIDEILNTLFEDNLKQKPESASEQIGKVKLDCTEVNTNNIPCHLSLERSNSLNFKLIPMIHSLNTVALNSTLKTNVEHATGLLTAIYDEMCQFNPISQPLCQENSCFETFDLDDNSVESLGIMRSFENVTSDLNSSLEKTRHSLDELRETLNISDDFELPTTANMSTIENNSHFSFDRFSYRQPNQSVCKPNNAEQPEIENLNDYQKDSQCNLDTTSSQADDKTKQNANNNFPQTVNLSNDTKDLQLGLRKNNSAPTENRKNQQISNKAFKIPFPLSDNEDDDDDDDDDETDIEVDDTYVDINAVYKENKLLTNNILTNVSKIPLAANDVKEKEVMKKEKTISETNVILYEASKIPLPLSDDEVEIENDKHQGKKIDTYLLKSKKTISLTKVIQHEAYNMLLPLSDDEEEVEIDKHNTHKIDKQIFKKKESMVLNEASKIPLPLSDDEEGVDIDKHLEKEGNKLFINNVHKQLHKDEEIISLLNTILEDVSKRPLSLSDDDDHGKVNRDKEVENVVRSKEKISPILSKIQNRDISTKYKSENIVRTTTFESQPGTSKQGQSLLKARKSSTILLPRLPSVPSTEITCLSLEEDNTIRTILRRDLSSSSSALKDDSSDYEEINLYNFSYLPSYSFDGTSTPLERKASTTNLITARIDSNSVHDDAVTESELDFYIQTNIRDFEESIQNTIDYNATISEVMNSSKINALEDSITIISTTSTNLLSENEGKDNSNSILELQSSTDQLLQNTSKDNVDDINLDLGLNSLENNAIGVEEIIRTKNKDKIRNKQESQTTETDMKNI